MTKRVNVLLKEKEFLEPTYYLDSDSDEVQSFTQEVIGDASDDITKAIRLFIAVRDRIVYDPYRFELETTNFKASTVLKDGRSFCIPKAILLAAAARAAGIPAQIGFADVKNHLCTARLLELMDTNVFMWHGYTVLYLDGQWVKATPAFNIQMCERFGVKPLDFDGKSDAMMHPHNVHNEKHMEYMQDHGWFVDFPYKRLVQVFMDNYPKLLEMANHGKLGNFEMETVVK